MDGSQIVEKGSKPAAAEQFGLIQVHAESSPNLTIAISKFEALGSCLITDTILLIPHHVIELQSEAKGISV